METGGTVTIESGKRSDLDQILEIENRSFGEDGFNRRQFIYLLTESKGLFNVIKIQGKVVAYQSLLTNLRTNNLRIYSIAVHPEARGRKLAQLLIDKAIEYAELNQLNAVTLEVNTSNYAAIGLYEKNGFVRTGMRHHYYHDGSDAYCMKRIIKE